MKPETLLKALNNISDEYIEETRIKMGAGEEKHRKSVKNIWRIALIAAVVAALLAVTAYAAGWFSIKDRVVPSSEKIDYLEAPGIEDKGPQEVGIVSSNGLADSPAAMATRDWNDFRYKYINSKEFVNGCDVTWVKNEQEDSYRKIYGAADRTMMDKLLEISEKYDVGLHKEIAVLPNMDYLYKAAGIEPFLKYEVEFFMPKYIFEDGSFVCEGDVNGNIVSLERTTDNVISNGNMSIPLDTEFEEWQYTAGDDTVSIALEKNRNAFGEYNAFIFFEKNGYYICVNSKMPEFNKSAAEKLADCFDYSKLCQGKPDLSIVLDTKPIDKKPKEGLLTLKDFMETPEYKAASEFNIFYCEYADTFPENRNRARGGTHYKYYGEFPGKDEKINAMREKAASEYSLTSPLHNCAIWSNEVIPSEYTSYITDSNSMWCNIDGKEHEELFESVSDEKYWEWLDVNGLISKGRPTTLVMYDNGAYCLSIWTEIKVYEINYIPKGSFYPLLQALSGSDGTSWAYDTECGEQVFISFYDTDNCNEQGYACIIYETDNAYVVVDAYTGNEESYRLEAVADSIDFTKFK